MDALAHQRRSRWDRAPVLDDRGRQRHAQLTERDIEMLKLLARYRYLSIDDIHAFVGGSRKGLAHHINLLSRKPNLYLNRPRQQRQSADANHRPMIYELDRRGLAVLRELGVQLPPRDYHRNFAHELMVCRIMTSFELGARHAEGIRIVTWEQMLASGKVPQPTVRSDRPTRIPVKITIRGSEHQTDINADGKPFGIEYRLTGAPPAYRFFPGVEADMGTEPLQPRDLERSSIAKKLLAYLAIERAGTHRSHFGVPNLFVPFVTTTEPRRQSMMALLGKLTDGRGSMSILFKSSSDGSSSGHMLELPWQRVGHPPLWLNRRSS
jgi:Replication-relaxation